MKITPEDRADRLAALLRSLFGDLHSMQRVIKSYDRALWQKVDQGLSLRSLSHAIVDALEQENRVDGRFFAQLVRERPGRERDIRAEQRLWQDLVLFLAANPKGRTQLALEEEADAIHTELARNPEGHKFGLVVRRNVSPGDWRREVEALRPRILHFSGHGTMGGRPVAETEDGEETEIPPAPMLEQLARVGVEGVVLSACYSDRLAEVIGRQGAWAAGMEGAVRDDVAIRFAAGFYEALAMGKSPEESFEWSLDVPRWERLPRPRNPRFFGPGSAVDGSGSTVAPTAPRSRSAGTPDLTVLASFLARACEEHAEAIRALFRSLGLAEQLPYGLAPIEEGSRAAEILESGGHLAPAPLRDKLLPTLARRFPGRGPELREVAKSLGVELPERPGPTPPTTEAITRAIDALRGERCVVRVVSWPQELEGVRDTVRIEAPAGWLGDDPAGAEAAVARPLADVATAVSRADRRLWLIPQCTPGTAIRAGQVFRRVTGLSVTVLHYGQEWPLDGRAESGIPPLVEQLERGTKPTALVVLLSITQDVRAEYDAWAEDRDANRFRVLSFGAPAGREPRACLTEPREAVTWAAQVGRRISEERKHLDGTGGAVHIFAAVPNPLAVAIGRELNALGRVVLHDLDRARNRYQVSYTFDS